MTKRRDPIPQLTVGEDPFERGHAHGRVFAREVADNVETYVRRFETSGTVSRDSSEGERAAPPHRSGGHTGERVEGDL